MTVTVTSVWNRGSFVRKKCACSEEFGTAGQAYNLQRLSNEALGSCAER